MQEMRATTWVRTATRAVATATLSSIVWVGMATAGAAAETPTKPLKPGDSAKAALAAEQARQKAGKVATTPAPAPQGRSGSSPAPPPASSTPAVTGQLGAKGDNVKKIEERLSALHYEVGPVDGVFDEDTLQGVIAFQKVHSKPRTGVVNQEVWAAMSIAGDPKPWVPNGGSRRVEIDIERQVLYLYEGGKLSRIIAVSTGTEVPYCENGNCGDAVTPRGDYAVYRQAGGWEYGPLGGLYNPSYFVGGVAVHGSLSVPPEPASHGCVRVPMSVAEWLPDKMPVGTPVYVR